MHTLHGSQQRAGVEDVSGYKLCFWADAAFEELRPAGETPYLELIPFEQFEKPSTDVTGGACK